MKLCACDKKALNTGQPTCIGQRDRTVGFVMVDFRDADGNINLIPAGQAMTDVYVSGKINETPDKRWNFLKDFKNVDQPVADPTTEDFDGVSEQVEDGVETFTGVRKDGSADPKFKAILDSRKCKDTGVFEITAGGELAGVQDKDGNLLPILIETGTMTTKYLKRTQAGKQKLQFDFAVSKTVYAGDYRYISAGQFEKNLLTYISLQDIVSSTSNEIVTGVTIKLTGCFGPWGQETPFTGLLLVDWVLTNLNTTLTVVPLTAVEQGDTGVYDLTFAAQTALDVIQYDFIKAGFELAIDPSTFTV